MSELDDLLAEWGRDHQLGQQAADEIRAAITAPDVLPAGWWRDLNARTNAAIVRATSNPQAFRWAA